MPWLVEPVAEPAVAAVEQEEREPDDDRRERERQVDERVQEPLAAGTSRRTIASAQTMPKTVFTGTAIAVMISVSLNAWIVSGVVSASQAGREAVLERPPEDERERSDEDHERGSRARRRAG